MLWLQPPFIAVEGAAAFPDHADPQLWHAVPLRPRLAVIDDRPAFELTLFADDVAGPGHVSGGFLALTTELALTEATLAAIVTAAGRARPGSGTPRVVPAAFDSGSVELTVLGRTSVPPPTGSAAPGGMFEVTFAAGGRPSLAGTNTAAFQVVLSESAASAILGSLQDAAVPVLVNYALTYQALRPAFTVDVHADWAKLFTDLSQRLTTNAWFVAADAEVAVRNAMESTGVSVDVVVEGGGDAAAAAERARTQLVDLVFDRLFESMVPPTSPAAEIGDVIEEAVWSLQRAVVPGASYRLKALADNELRSFAIRARERVAEAREVRPQGTVDALLRTLRTLPDGSPDPDWETIRSGLVHRIELRGFPRLVVAVSVVDRFGSDGLRSVEVEFAHGQRPDDPPSEPVSTDITAISLTAAAPSATWVLNLLADAAQPDWKRPYRYRVTAHFDPATGLLPGQRVTGEWTDANTADLYVEPRSVYAATDVTLTVAPLFSFTLFPVVSVELAAGTATSATAQLTLDAEHPLLHWVAASTDPSAGYSYRPTFHRPVEAGGAVVGDWTHALEPFVSLPDPMPEKLMVTFFVALPWPQIAFAMLELAYADEAAGIRYAPETVVLSAATINLQRTYSIASAGSRELAYRLTVQRTDGTLVEGSWRTTTDDRVIVDSRLIEQRQVRVRVLGALADRGLATASLHLEVRAADGNPRAQLDTQLASPTAIAPFVYPLGDPPQRTVWWRLSGFDTNGFAVVQPWGSGTSDLLVVDLRSLTVTG